MEFTLIEIIAATGAKILKNEVGENDKFTFSTDTRTIKKGQIYLPLTGESFDGEKFIDKALEMGAIGCFISKQGMENIAKSEKQKAKSEGDTFCTLPFAFCSKLILQVDDTRVAYLQLARFYRRKINPKTIAITGSSGKTTTKEMAFCVASEKFKTHKSELNFNNEIGLCKTILSMPEDTQVLILEMGMRGLGEIELLSEYSEPDISIIANVGSAHIGRLGSRENIAKAKFEIVKYMRNGGTLIAHDDELVKNEIEAKSKKQKVKSEADTFCPWPFAFCPTFFSLSNVKIIERSIGYSKFEYRGHEYELNIEGDYNIQNALAVIEMGLLIKMSESEIASGLIKYSPIEKRWDVLDIKGFKIINDSYNANPESMRGVIKTVLDIYSPPLLLILGDMAELGEKEVEYHEEIGEFLIKNLKENVKVLTVGKLADEITKKLNDSNIFSKNFENNMQISRYILDNVHIGTTIVLKASRSMKFEEIVEKIKDN